MSKTILKIKESKYITHDVKQFILEKPKDLVYSPGQAGSFSINLPGWEDKIRPFTFTSLNDWPILELIVKIYPSHNGVTNKMQELSDDDELILHDVFDTIKYKGPGIFLAGGTGITPFIAIFRALYLSGNMRNVGLIYSNRSEDDIILKGDLEKMLGVNYINVFTRQGVIGFQEKHIDKKFLIEKIQDFDQRFYLCGPDGFVRDLSAYLISLGADPEGLVV